MRIEGLRIAIITAKHSPAVQVIALPHAWVSWMLRGACRLPCFSIKLFGPEENIGPSVYLRKQKLRLEAWGNSGGCRRWTAGFAAFSDQSWWMIFFGVLRSHKKCRNRKCAGRAPDRAREGRISGGGGPTKPSATCTIFSSFLFFVRTNAMNAAVKVSYRVL